MSEENTEPNEVIRLPLWRTCVDNMRKEGIEYGKVYLAEYFEDRLKCQRHAMEFSLAISEIRRDLETSGFYLSGRGQNGNKFVILPPQNNQAVMRAYQRSAIDSLKRGVILGTNTRLDLLSPEDRKSHEAMLERMAVKTVLLQRSTSVFRVVKKNAPKLLEKAG